MRFYDGAVAREDPSAQGARAAARPIPPTSPRDKTAYALRDVAFLEREAARHGDAIGAYAHALLAVPLPVDAHAPRLRAARARQALRRRARRGRRAELALAADLLDVTRLKRMLVLASPPPPAPPTTSPQRLLPLARYLRPAADYALVPLPRTPEGGDR